VFKLGDKFSYLLWHDITVGYFVERNIKHRNAE
jgi:hypothetical protein